MALNENQQWVYGQLKDNGFDLGNEDEFLAAMSDEANRRWVYDSLGKSGIEMGDFGEFEQAIKSEEERQSIWKTIGEAGKGAAAGFMKMLNDIGNITGPVANPYAMAADADYAAHVQRQQTHTFDEKHEAAKRVEEGTGSEEDKELSAGVRLSGQLGEERDKYQKSARKNIGDANFTDLIAQKRFRDAFELGLITSIESAPQMAMGLNVPGRILLGSLTAADEFDRLTKERPDMSVTARVAQATMAGALEQFFESKFNPLKLEGKLAKGTISSMVRELRKHGARVAINDLGKVLKSWGIDAAGEGLEEVLTTMSTDLVKYVVGWMDEDGESFNTLYEEARAEAEKNGQELTKKDFATSIGVGLLNDFIGGAMAGGYMGSVSHGVQAAGTVKADLKEKEAWDKLSKKEQNRRIAEADMANAVVSELAIDHGMNRRKMLEELDKAAEMRENGALDAKHAELLDAFTQTLERERQQYADDMAAAEAAVTPVGTEGKKTQAEKPKKGKGVVAEGREVEIGDGQKVSFTGTNVVYNEDGSINWEQSGNIFIKNADGDVIVGDHTAVHEAIDEALRTEKNNGEELMKHDVPVEPISEEEAQVAEATEEEVQKTPEEIAAEEAAEANEAENARRWQIFDEVNALVQQGGPEALQTVKSPESQFIYIDIKYGKDEAIKYAQSMIEHADSIKNPLVALETRHAWQALIDQYGQKEQQNEEIVAENLDNSEKSITFAPKSESNDDTGVQPSNEGGNQSPQSESQSGGLEGDRGGVVEDNGEDDGSGNAAGTRVGIVVVDSLEGLNEEVDNQLRSKGVRFPDVRVVRVGAQDFHDAIASGKEKNADGWRVDVKDVEDLEHCYCMLTPDGHAGIAVKEDGDIVSLFSDDTYRGISKKLLLMAIANGGRKADFFMTPNYDHGLQNLYWRFGARITGQNPFSEEVGRQWVDGWPAYYDELVEAYGEEGRLRALNHPTAAAIFPSTVDEALNAFAERRNKNIEDELGTEEIAKDQIGLKGVPVFDDYDKMMDARDAELAESQESKAESGESIRLDGDDIVLMSKSDNTEKVFCRKTEDGKLIRLDNGKALMTEKGGKKTGWQNRPKEIVYYQGKAYYKIGENQGVANLVAVETTMPVLTKSASRGDGSSMIKVDRNDLQNENGEYFNRKNRRDEKLDKLLKEAKTIDDVLDYVVFDRKQDDGSWFKFTLRELLDMFSVINDSGKRKYVGDVKFQNIFDKMMEKFYGEEKLVDDFRKNGDLKEQTDAVLRQAVGEGMRAWNQLFKDNKVQPGKSLTASLRNFVKAVAIANGEAKSDNLKGKTTKEKRMATADDLAKREALREQLKEASTKAEMDDINEEIMQLMSEVDFSKKATEEVQREEPKESPSNLNNQETQEEELSPIQLLEKERERAFEMMEMARKHGNAEIEAELLAKVNELGKRISEANQKELRAHIGPEEMERRKENGMKIVDILRKKGIKISLVSEEKMLSLFDEEYRKLLEDNNEIPYGVEIVGEIYLLENYLDANTPIHEYTHLWVDLFAQKHPDKWNQIVEVLKQTQTWQDVLTDEDYQSIRDNEYEIAGEVMSRLTGDYWSEEFMGKTRLDDTLEGKKLGAKVRSVLRSFWEEVCRMLGKNISRRNNKNFENQLKDILNMPLQDILGEDKKETNFDKKFKKIQEGLDKGGDNVLSLQSISELTDALEDDLRQGNRPLVFERVPLEALQEGLRDERTLAEALTIVGLRSRRQHRVYIRDGKAVTAEETNSRDASDIAMQLDLIRYAKEKGMWVEDIVDALDAQYGKENRVEVKTGESTGESHVWIDKANGRVIKAKADYQYETMEELLEGMLLNNYIFKGDRQHIIGFGIDRTDGRDAIRVIYEAPYVEKSGSETLTQEQKDRFMAAYGFKKTDSPITTERKGEKSNYTNGTFIVGDLHNQNIFYDADGDVRCIDPIIKWGEGEHYKEPTIEQQWKDAENDEVMDALFDGEEMRLMVGDKDPRNISQEVKEAMGKRKEATRKADKNVHTKPAERLEGNAKLIYQVLDNTHGLYLLQGKINAWRKAHGMSPIPDSMDVRSLLNRCGSAIASRVTLFEQRQEKRLKEVTDKIAEKVGKSALMERFAEDLLEEEKANGTKFHYAPTAQDLLERYLVARDNIERAERGIPTRGEREFTERMGVSMAEYAEMFQNLFTDKELKELWGAVRACTNTSLNELLRGKRISQEDYDAYMERQFYVPEKDFAERETNEDLAEDEEKERKGKNRRATAVEHKAEGGESLATNILAHIISDAKNSIAVAQENLVKVAMYDLMNDNLAYAEEYGIPRPSRVWYVKIGENANGEPVYERTTERPSQDLIDEAEMTKKLIKEQQERLRNEKDADKREQIKAAIDYLKSALPIVGAKQAGDGNLLEDRRSDVPTVKVYINGVQHEMTFNGMEEVADALNGEYDLRGNNTNIRKANAIIASMFTTYNPTFFAVNLARDTPYILAKGYSQYGLEFVGAFGKALTSELPSTSRQVRKYLSGELDESTPDGKMFYDFLMGGGNTGYTQLKNIRDIKKDFEGSAFGKTRIGQVFDIGAKLNEYSELLTRFAAYRAMMETGHSQNEALNAAKNLSVNFNRRGAGNKFLNYFNSLSMFSNAAIQGASGFFRAFDNGKNIGRGLFGLVFMPAFLGFMNTMLCPDDDDDEFVVSDYYRDNYCVLGGLKIPLPEQFRPFWAMGVNIGLAMQGRSDAGQFANRVIQSFTQYLLPVPPAVSQAMMKTEGALFGESQGLEDAAEVASTLMLPQFASGVSEIAHNKDFMGNTIRKQDLGAVPQYKLGQNEAALYQDIAKFFYWANGGDTQVPLKYKKGSIDEEVGRWYVPLPANVNPKEVHKAMGIMIPAGWLNVACSIYGFGKDMLPGEDDNLRAKDAPLAGTFWRPEDETMFRYTNYKEMKRLTDAYDAIAKEVVKEDRGALASGDNGMHDAIVKEMKDKVERAAERGFDPVYWKQLEGAYKATSVYDIAAKLGKTEDGLRKEYPELESLDDFQRLVGQLINQELMEYHGIEHHVPWLQEQMEKLKFWKKK